MAAPAAKTYRRFAGVPSGTWDLVACHEPRASDKTALVVDDEAPIRALVKLILSKHGFTVDEAPDGRHALSLLTSRHQCVDLLVTDVVMPGGVNGVTVAEAFMLECPSTRVVLMSGYTDTESINLESNGRWLFVSKPFSPHALVQALRTLGWACLRSEPGPVRDC